MVDVVVLNYNDAITTIDFINHVKDFESISHIMIVDNASTDDSFEKLSLYKNDRIHLVLSPTNGGYGAGNNLGIKELYRLYNSEYILLANPDVIIEEKAIIATETFLRSHQNYALAAPYMCKPDGTKTLNSAGRIPKPYQYALTLGVLYSKFKHPGRYSELPVVTDEYKDVGMLAGSCFMMNAKLMINHGMYDEKMFLFCEEVVLGIKMRDAGYKVALLPNESFIHNHSVSINKTYKSEIAKKKILVNSKMYVLENYYHLRPIQLFITKCLAKISILEVKMMGLMKR